MAKFYIFGAIALCLAAQCALAQYQTAPAYGNGYKQQRKMAPNPQTYGQQQQQQQQQQQSMSNYGSGMQTEMDNYDNNQNSEQAASGYKQQAAGGRGQMSGYGNSGSQMSGGYGSKQGAQKYEEPQHPPMPFNWGYDINDGYGATQFHKEMGDEQGKRTGSYGYMDPFGVYRHVNYVADENGFRATVKTNEPGTANESPADVDWTAEEPPATVNMGNKNSGYGSSSGSSGSYGSGSGSGSSEGGNGQYGSSSSSSSGSGNKYGSGAADNEQQQYGASMGDSARQYGGSSSSSMAAGSGGKQYGSGAMGMMGMGSSGKQYGGSSMMMSSAAAGAVNGGGQYGAQNSPMMAMMMPASAGGSQYGAPMMGARNGNGNGNKSRRYNSKQQMAAGSRTMMGGKQYGSMMGAAETEQATTQRYDSMTMATQGGDSQMQEYGAMMPMAAAAMNGAMRNQQQYGSGSANGMAAGLGQEDEMSGQQYRSSSSANDDSALAQQYGPSGMSDMAGIMDGTSVYASTRMQPLAASSSSSLSAGSYGGNRMSGSTPSGSSQYGGETKGQQQAASAGGDYGMQRAGASAGSSGYGKSMSTGSNMDYKKQAKSIAALVKRY